MSDVLTDLDSNQEATVEFITGLSFSGTLSSNNGWTWANTDPAIYSATAGSAHKWGGGEAGTSGGTVSYYFDPGSGFSPSVESMYVGALTLWSDEANIQFVETTDPGQAQLSFYLPKTLTPNVPITDDSAYAVAVYATGAPGDTNIPATQAVTVAISPSGGFGQLDSFTDTGGYGPGTIVHELGHAMGLMHSGPYNGNVNAATQQYNTTDTFLWSIMSYIAPGETNTKYYSEYPVTGTNLNTAQSATTPQMLDILGVQELYGLPTSTTYSGGQVFGFNTNITDPSSVFFNFNVNVDPVVTIWDSGTGNTLDLSGFYTPSYVDLNPGTFSSADGMINNIGIAYATKIDAAIGGAGDDTFEVNADSDTIDGGNGNNTVVFPFAYAAYVITPLGNGSYTVSDGATTDTISNVQTLAFADQEILVSELPIGDQYQWNAASGDYGQSANWLDVTTGAPATAPPGADNVTSIPGPTSGGPITISGTGTAAQLVFTGLVGVTGDLTPDLLTVGQGNNVPAMLTVAPGAEIEATSADIANGTVKVNGTLIATDLLTIAPVDLSSSATLVARSGGFVDVGALALNGGSIGVDATSTFEVGTAGLGTAGVLTIDAGAIVSGNGSLPSVVDNGTIVVDGGTLSVSSLSGTGTVEIAGGGVLAVSGTVTTPITFDDNSGEIFVGSVGRFTNITNFQPGDAIVISTTQPVQQPVYNTQAHTVAVPIAGGGFVMGATLTGDYSNNVFVLLPTGTNEDTLITAVGSLTGSTTPSEGTQQGGAFAWSAGTLMVAPGDWNNPAMWQDLGRPPQNVAPGKADEVFIQGANQPANIQVISGNGNADNLAVAGANAFSGTISVTGSLEVGAIGNPALLALIGTADVNAGSATIFADGVLDVASGTTFAITNSLTLISDGDQGVAPLEIYGGGRVQVGSLILSGTAAPIALDGASFLEVGTAGTATAGALTVDPGGVISGTGTLSATNVLDNGTIIAQGGELTLGKVSGTGTLAIDNNAILNLSVSEPDTIMFRGNDATLLVSNTRATLGVVMGFVQGDTIAVAALPEGLPTSVTYTATGENSGTLTLSNAFNTNIQLTLQGDYANTKFTITPGSSPAVADITIACFAKGTLITTDHGPVAVEAVCEGDLVMAHFAQAPRPVVWIGHRYVDCRRHPEPHKVWPVRFQADCFGPGMPSRDLFLSPDHAVLVNDVLVPAKYLINGTTVVQVEVAEVTYYHLELAEHDVVFAEGVATESYLDTGDRSKFANGGNVVSAYPDFSSRLWEASGCAPLIIAGPALAKAKRQLARAVTVSRPSSSARKTRPRRYNSAA